MNREAMIEEVRTQGDTAWDIVVIGGGATGAGVAVDAATRGYKTLLVEREDFGKGTSSRSTKLVHGGVRRTSCTICRSWCPTMSGGKRRSTASA